MKEKHLLVILILYIMKTKIFFVIIAGLCCILIGQKSFADCTTTITVDSYKLTINDGSCTNCNYNVQERVVASVGGCPTSWFNFGNLFTTGTWTIPQESFSGCKNPTAPPSFTYWIVVKVTRLSDNAVQYAYSNGEYPDINLHIQPGDLTVNF